MTRSAESDGTEESECDLEEEIIELDIISKLNLAFKTIEILGQILKNYYGSLRGEIKRALGEEAYLIGLRSLNSFISILGDNIDHFVNGINSIIERKRIVDKDKIEAISRKVLFHFCQVTSYVFIRKVAGCVGSEKLSKTFEDILEDNDTNSFHLIDISIQLDYFREFPYPTIKKLKKRFSGNTLFLMPYYNDS